MGLSSKPCGKRNDSLLASDLILLMYPPHPEGRNDAFDPLRDLYIHPCCSSRTSLSSKVGVHYLLRCIFYVRVHTVWVLCETASQPCFVRRLVSV